DNGTMFARWLPERTKPEAAMPARYLVSPATLVLLALPVVILLTCPDSQANNDALVEGGPKKQSPSTNEEQKSPVEGRPVKFEDQSLKQWLEQLRMGKPKERVAAAKALANHLDPDDTAAIPALIEALKDKEGEVRSEAARAL